eukprot:m.217086 g.217086  ORF g.217086 m.217086 type:complete len:311 (-) comp33227_c1_seq1:65-997(-)
MFKVDVSCASLTTDEDVQKYNLCGVDSLNLSRNNLTVLPALWNLSSQLQSCVPTVKYIELTSNELQSLAGIGNKFPSLVSIKGGNNNICTIPNDDLRLLPALTFLSLVGNCISTIPAEIGTLQFLSVLSLSQNNIETLPQELATCSNLRELYLAGNKLSHIPLQLLRLQQLHTLDLSRNNFREVPIVITAFLNLVLFVFNGNPATRGSMTQSTTVKEIQFRLFSRIEWSLESHELLKHSGAQTTRTMLLVLWLSALRFSRKLASGSIPSEMLEIIARHFCGADFWWPADMIKPRAPRGTTRRILIKKFAK